MSLMRKISSLCLAFFMKRMHKKQAVNTSTEQGQKKLMRVNKNICSALLLEIYKDTQLGVGFACTFSGNGRDITVLILFECGKDIQKLL